MPEHHIGFRIPSTAFQELYICCGKQQILVRQCELSALGSEGRCEDWCMPWTGWRNNEVPLSHSSSVLHSLWCGRHLLEGRVDW